MNEQTEGQVAGQVAGQQAEVRQGTMAVRTPVTTLLGSIDQSDLVINVETTDLPDQIVVAREWVYAGSDLQHKEHVGKMVRRDVWITVKHGLSAAGEQGG